MEYQFRKAETADINLIWNLLQQAILRRKAEGSSQWQDGYPNRGVIQNDIERGAGFVLTYNNAISGYAAVIVNDEPAYAAIEGNWLTNDDFVVVHRMVISADHIGKGLARRMLKFVEDYAISRHIHSIKADTNFDNTAMIKTFEKSGYVYCGEVSLRGSPRRAYEKVLISGRGNSYK